MDRAELIETVQQLRDAIRAHRDALERELPDAEILHIAFNADANNDDHDG
jgi:hypothetical protein